MMKKELRPTTKRWIVREQVGLTNKTKGAYAKACVCAEVGYDAGAQRQHAGRQVIQTLEGLSQAEYNSALHQLIYAPYNTFDI